MEEKKEIKQQKINIELDEKTAPGDYANLTIITHSPAEFVLDFIGMLPGMPKAKVKSRIIMAPQHVKSLLRVLNDNITKYENKFGEIKVHKHDTKGFGLKFPEDALPN
ncbi:MAG: DUF3467 domain-containing protein [FCB group bacterium]|nr:DUF3467 domain-containing protein [FCB group bacterium]